MTPATHPVPLQELAIERESMFGEDSDISTVDGDDAEVVSLLNNGSVEILNR